MSDTVFYLRRNMFGEKERRLAEHGDLRVSSFLYDSGVHGLRLANTRGELVMLPFHGQQIWSMHMDGRNLTMKSMFNTPRPTRDYLSNYGGFMLHCGATAMGVAGPTDSHPTHGELPNAPYDSAFLRFSEDEAGSFVELGGSYKHTVAFSHNYLATPSLKLHADSSLVKLSMTINNLKHTEMELMYLAHINFRPVDNGRLVYSAKISPETVRVRRSIPSHVTPKAGYKEFIDDLGEHPEKHHVLKPGLAFDPEIVFNISYTADRAGWAHSAQIHPDGTADVVRHRPAQLDTGVRWICRTPDQDAIGIILPATAEPEGYTAEKAKGNLKLIPAGGSWHCDMEIGSLSATEASSLESSIKDVTA